MTSAEAIDFHGLPAVRWHGRDGSSAIATLQGAHVVSWVPAGGEEALYLSPRSAFEPGRAIRGGIPVVFPQFADRGPLGQHGFARTLEWTWVDALETEQGSCVQFALEDSPETRALWPHVFRLGLSATIAEGRLDVELRVESRGAAGFDFAAALHTYVRVSDAAATCLEGLRGTRYVNRGESALQVEARDAIGAGEPIDRVYFAAPPVTRVDEPERGFRLAQRGFTDTVVWNPGAERTSQMADMPPDGFRHMVCVEAAAVDPPVRLSPGATWVGGQSLAVLPKGARTP